MAAPSTMLRMVPLPRFAGEEHRAASVLQAQSQLRYTPAMTSAETIAALRSHAAAIRARGVTALYLFGSAARGEARPDSGVDIFVDYDPETFDFVHLIRLGDELSRVLGRPVDLGTRDGLHPDLRADIEAEAVRVF